MGSRMLISSFVEEDKRASMALHPEKSTAPSADVATVPTAPAATGLAVDTESKRHVLLEYALYLGMDIVKDADLLWIAQQAVTAELPAGWQEHTDPMSGDSYFHNSVTGETEWEHPCDAYYKDLYAQLKQQRQVHADPMAEMQNAAMPPNRYLDPLRRKRQQAQQMQQKAEECKAQKVQKEKRNAEKRARKEKKCTWRIQRHWRARRFRNRVNFHILKKQSAIKVQARVRGVLCRRRVRRMIAEQVREMATVRLQAAIRGALVRLMMTRRRKIKEATLRAKKDSIASKAGHQAFLQRVGAKASIADEEDEASRYSQLFAAAKIQARFRGRVGRMQAEARAQQLREQYFSMMQVLAAARLVQRYWRSRRDRPLHSPAPTSAGRAGEEVGAAQVGATEDTKATGHAAQLEKEGCVRKIKKLHKTTEMATAFPILEKLLVSHQQLQWSYEGDAGPSGSLEQSVVAERIRRLDSMGAQLIWIQPDHAGTAGHRAGFAKHDSRWKKALGGSERGAAGSPSKERIKGGTVMHVLSAAKSQVDTDASDGDDRASALEAAAKRRQQQGASHTVVQPLKTSEDAKMAFHFFKTKPLVSLRYLQQDAVAQAQRSGYVEQEYSLAVNLANTGSVFVQICKFDDALRLVGRAITTFSAHAETTKLANSGDKLTMRRLERCVCAHNVAIYAVYAGRMKQGWELLSETHRALRLAGLLPSEARQQHVYALAIHKTHVAMERVMRVVVEAPQQEAATLRAAKGRGQELPAAVGVVTRGPGRKNGGKGRARDAMKNVRLMSGVTKAQRRSRSRDGTEHHQQQKRKQQSPPIQIPPRSKSVNWVNDGGGGGAAAGGTACEQLQLPPIASPQQSAATGPIQLLQEKMRGQPSNALPPSQSGSMTSSTAHLLHQMSVVSRMMTG